MLLPEYIELLKENPLFYSIETRKYEVLLETFHYRLEHFKSGEEITRDFDDIGILMSGEVRILKESIDNSATVVERVELGGVFGEVLTCLHTNGSPYKVMAQTDCAVILIPYNNLLAPTEYQDHFTVLSNLMRLLSRRNLLVERKLEVLSKRTLADKILTFLAIQREITGSDTFIIPYSRMQLSEYLCVDRSALSRELSNLKQLGLIRYKKNLFTVMTSYEDVDFDEEDEDDEEDEVLSIEEGVTSLLPNLEDSSFGEIKEIPKSNLSNEDDIINDILINEPIKKIEIDDEEIDNISIDDILNDNIQISTKNTAESTSLNKDDIEDDYFAQEYAKLNDIDIDDIDTADVINEMIQDGVLSEYFDKETSKEAFVYEDEDYDYDDEIGDESAMSEALREEQAKVFSQFVDKAREIASRNMQANLTTKQEKQHEKSMEAFADRLIEELLPRTANNDENENATDLVQEVQEVEEFQEVEEVEEFQEVEEVENVEELFEEIPIGAYQEITINREQLATKEQVPQGTAPLAEQSPTAMQELVQKLVEEQYTSQLEETGTAQEQEQPPEEEVHEPEETAPPVEESAPHMQEIVQEEVQEVQEIVEEVVETAVANVANVADVADVTDETAQTNEGSEIDRDTNLLLEPIETLVEKVAEELAPKSIHEAIEKLKKEVLPTFAPYPKDVQATTEPTEQTQPTDEQTPPPTQPTQEVEEVGVAEEVHEGEEDEMEEEIDEIGESTVEEIVEEIAETLSKGKTKKQAKPGRFNLFKKFKGG